MSKKKKKTEKRTLRQNLRARFGAAGAAARRARERLGKDLPAAAEKAYRAADSFIRLKWSVPFIAAVMLALMLFSYSFTAYRYLFGRIPYYVNLTVPLYLADYKVGFVSRALVGQILSFFTDKVSLSLVISLTKAALWVSLIVLALLAAAAFKKAWLKKSPLLCVLFVFFAVTHHTVMPNIINFGVLDTYNLMLAVLCVYLSDTKAGRAAAPLLCFTGIILHYQFVVAYLPCILLIELYLLLKKPEGRRLRTVSFFITAAGSAALAVYLMFFSKNGAKMSPAELADYMRAKFTDYRRVGLFDEYFTYYIYGDFQGANYSAPADFVKFLVNYSLERINVKSLVCYAFSLVPLYGVFWYFWIFLFRRGEKRTRLPYALFMLLPLVFIACVIVSTDTSRWAGASVFSHFALLFTVLRTDEQLLGEAAARAVATRLKKCILALALAVSYCASAYIYYYR